MPRFYVEKDGEWNIFSTIIDDFIFDEFVCLDVLKARLLYERYKELTEDIDSLLINRPRVNVMPYSDAMERIRKTENSSENPNNCEPTWEQVKEYCNKRCLDIVDSALRKKWYKDEPQTCSFSDCGNFKNPDYERCIECKRKQIKLKTEQTEWSE